MNNIIVTHGYLGWGNRKAGEEAYGPGGRWAKPRLGQKESGDLLGDHLHDLGATEGALLIVVVVPSRFEEARRDRIEHAIRTALSEDTGR